MMKVEKVYWKSIKAFIYFFFAWFTWNGGFRKKLRAPCKCALHEFKHWLADEAFLKRMISISIFFFSIEKRSQGMSVWTFSLFFISSTIVLFLLTTYSFLFSMGNIHSAAPHNGRLSRKASRQARKDDTLPDIRITNDAQTHHKKYKESLPPSPTSSNDPKTAPNSKSIDDMTANRGSKYILPNNEEELDRLVQVVSCDYWPRILDLS